MIAIDKNDLELYLEDGDKAYYFITCDDKECEGKSCQNPHTAPKSFDFNTSMPIKCRYLKPNHVYSVTVRIGSLFKLARSLHRLVSISLNCITMIMFSNMLLKIRRYEKAN